MKILHISPQLSPAGVNRYAADLALKLQENGAANILLSPANGLIGQLTEAGVRHIPLQGCGLAAALRNSGKLNRIIRSQLPDIVQAYSPAAAWMAWLACRKLPAKHRPALIGLHCGFPHGRLLNRAYGKMDAQVALSAALRKRLEQNNASKEPIRVIPYGMDEQCVSPAYRPSADWMEQWKQSQKEHENDYKLCIAAPITHLHNFEQAAPLLQALQKAGIRARLYIVGNTKRQERGYINKLREYYEEEGVAPQICWLGKRPDLRDILCACDVFLSLCKESAVYERPVLEALSLGRPVAGYATGAVGEMLLSFLPEGRVPVGDIHAMADSLIQWHSYPPESIARIPYPYSLKNSAESFMELYRRLCRQNRP